MENNAVLNMQPTPQNQKAAAVVCNKFSGKSFFQIHRQGLTLQVIMPETKQNWFAWELCKAGAKGVRYA